MNLDWHRLKAVVLESDDWGLCAWVPDEQAHRVLAGQPAFRTPAGQRYGRSTLESATDVRELSALLQTFRGGDGMPPVWQANTIVAAPDYARLQPPLFAAEAIPLVGLDVLGGRWERPGMFDAVRGAIAEGVWWPELHGLHHLPESAWLHALRRGQEDAHRAQDQQSPICTAVESSGEYDAAEPREVRARVLREAIARFEQLFGRAPGSFCPPDYRFDDWLEAEAATLGLTTIQGKPEQAGAPLQPLRRRILKLRFPHTHGTSFYLPPRIAFEPRGDAKATALGAQAAHRSARDAWGRGQPAIISSHRLNYAHLDAQWSANGRAALRELLTSLCADGALFLIDAEVRSLAERGWSVRAIGTRGMLLRHYGVPREPLRFPVPEGVTGSRVLEARVSDAGVSEASASGSGGSPISAASTSSTGSSPANRGPQPPSHTSTIKVEGGVAEARVNLGEHLVEWIRS